MPECVGFGRLIAWDLIGMGDSDKLPDSTRTMFGALAVYIGDRIVFCLGTDRTILALTGFGLPSPKNIRRA